MFNIVTIAVPCLLTKKDPYSPSEHRKHSPFSEVSTHPRVVGTRPLQVQAPAAELLKLADRAS